jgi:hypothetical protein
MVIVVAFVVVLPFLGLTFTVTTQLPFFKALIDVPETLQIFLLLLDTESESFAFFGTANPVALSRQAFFVNFPFFALQVNGAAAVGAEATWSTTTFGVCVTAGAMQSERESDLAGLVYPLGHAVCVVEPTVATK